jgi:peptide/nickel transport system permease protein
MSGYIIRRVIVAIIVTIGIAVISFLLLHYLSPSPVYSVLGAKTTPEAAAAWNQSHGFDRSEPAQLITYLGHLVRLQFGFSYKLGQSVSALFKENAGRSAYLTFAALLLSLVFAIPIGILQAVRRNSVLDYTVTGWNFVLYSMPSFFLGLILIQLFSLGTITTIFPPVVSDNITTAWQAFTHPLQLTLPIVTLAAINVASFSRYMRSSALDNLAQDYIRLARAKGLSQRAVLFRHLLRNACLPMITLVGLSVPTLLAGNLLIEYLFNYPGLGLLFYQALGNQDYNILLAYTVLGGILTVLGNLLADIAITYADPRVRVN